MTSNIDAFTAIENALLKAYDDHEDLRQRLSVVNAAAKAATPYDKVEHVKKWKQGAALLAVSSAHIDALKSKLLAF